MTPWEKDHLWLKSLKVGDTVFLSQAYGLPPEKSVVLKITAHNIIVKWGQSSLKYRPDVGSQRGGDMWTRSYLIQDTPKVREKIAMNRLIAKARHMRDRLLIPGESNKLKEFIKALEPYVIKEEEKA